MSALQCAIAKKAHKAKEDESYLQRLEREMEEENRREEEADNTWRRARWEAARKAMADPNYKRPEIRIPVIMSPDGPISSAEKLQQLAQLDSLPETLNTIIIREDGEDANRPVTISHVSHQEAQRIEERADIIPDYLGRIRVLFREKPRFAMVIKSLKEGVKLQYTSAQQQLRREMEEKTRQAEEDKNTWQQARWEAARKAMADGTYKIAEIRIPVVITPDGPVSSARHLQQLAEMDTVPETLEATLIRDCHMETERPVTVCYVNCTERDSLEQNANIEYNLVGKFTVRIGEQERFAIVVLSLKEDDSLPGKGKASIN